MTQMQQAQLQAMLGDVSQSPLAKLALRYWWASIPVGIAIYGKLRERMDKGEKLKVYTVFADAGSIIGPVSTIIGLSEVARRMDARGAFEKGNSRGTVTDAEFTTVNPSEGTTHANS